MPLRVHCSVYLLNWMCHYCCEVKDVHLTTLLSVAANMQQRSWWAVSTRAYGFEHELYKDCWIAFLQTGKSCTEVFLGYKRARKCNVTIRTTNQHSNVLQGGSKCTCNLFSMYISDIHFCFHKEKCITSPSMKKSVNRRWVLEPTFRQEDLSSSRLELLALLFSKR